MMEAEEIIDLIRPILPQIIGEYFRIMEEVESDEVLSALQVIVLQFGEDIKDMAPQMVERLLQIFLQHANEGNVNDHKCCIEAIDFLNIEMWIILGEDDDEAVFTATQCLDTVTSVMNVRP